MHDYWEDWPCICMRLVSARTKESIQEGAVIVTGWEAVTKIDILFKMQMAWPVSWVCSRLLPGFHGGSRSWLKWARDTDVASAKWIWLTLQCALSSWHSDDFVYYVVSVSLCQSRHCIVVLWEKTLLYTQALLHVYITLPGCSRLHFWSPRWLRHLHFGNRGRVTSFFPLGLWKVFLF